MSGRNGNGTKPKRQRVVITIRDNDDETGFTATMEAEPSASKRKTNSPCLNAAARLKFVIQKYYQDLVLPLPQEEEKSLIILP